MEESRSLNKELQSDRELLHVEQQEGPLPKRAKLEDEECPANGNEVKNNGGLEGDHTRERDVGMTEYISKSTSRFSGVIKQRYSDFIVHEISLDGQIVRLTNTDLPPDPNQESKDRLMAFLSNEELEQLKQLSTSEDKSKNVDLKSSASKELRTNIHMAIRNEYPMLDSRTITGDREDVIMIRVFLKGRGGGRGDWPRQFGDYVKFVLYKENRDSSKAISILASMLRVKSSVFQYGGTKDKRAITTQHMTAYRVRPQRLLDINKANVGITLGNFEYVKSPMKLGLINGNHFTIVLRNVESTSSDDCLQDTIRYSMESLRDVGFINYFGMQRFGTSTIPTHHVGKALLHSDWQQAIDLILKPRTGEPQDVTAMREHYSTTKDPSSTLAMMPKVKGNSVEMHLLKGLQQYGPTNLLAALKHIPKGTRMMYCHGYQSYIWNKMASFRVSKYGLVPIPGDLVYKKQNGNETELDSDTVVDVEVLTEDNINQFSIYDIVLTVPGFTVKYPKNEVGKEYVRAMLEDNLSSEKLMHRVRDFSLPGGYRRLLIKPENVEWGTIKYSDLTISLCQSDLDILEGKSPPKPVEESEGSKTALRLSFTLPSATYATMALREVLKTETSSHFQSQLNESNEIDS